ncbi:MAG: hypothetical protein KatS3mg031_2164 [Chitinophagales bacterium]|nr:MAG: hypothetical protein KatS3mg031_2164 [Chitinophagales bacterium]
MISQKPTQEDAILREIGVGRIYQQTFIDTYNNVAQAKLYDRKHAITTADMLNDRFLPFFEQHQLPLLSVLTKRGTEYCGRMEHHDYQLYLNLKGIKHSKTKGRSPQSNSICERFHLAHEKIPDPLASGR